MPKDLHRKIARQVKKQGLKGRAAERRVYQIMKSIEEKRKRGKK